MHIVMTYDLSATNARRTEIEERIEGILQPYRHVKRLSTFYVIHIDSAAMAESIRQGMDNLSREITETLLFIISPMMTGGKYNGLLQLGQWEELNAITNLD